ncbi:hypothetical protein [Methyloglobulus sp.]|uniref:hypothetical protein n=1 Tax=Methyloglobulus sp. TaxID=2518622 RepID=UPI00398A055E
MNQENIPVQSTKSLINATLAAVLLAMVILFTTVLPAEYGIDPTGLGKKMGLTVLAGQSSQIAAKGCPDMGQAQAQAGDSVTESNANQVSATVAQQTDIATERNDTLKIVIPPQKSLEYKFYMERDHALDYSWVTDGKPIYFDFHGEPKGAKDGYFKSYATATDSKASGSLMTPFEGIHSWFWENGTDQPITIRLNTKGVYKVLGVM